MHLSILQAHPEEVGDVVTERAIVRMLLNGHDLDGVVAKGPAATW